MRILLLFLILLSSTAYAQHFIQDAPFMGKKAIKFQDSAYHWDTGRWIKLKADQVSTHYPSEAPFDLQWEGFLKQASLVITLAQENLQYANPEYLELFQQTKSKVDFYLQAAPLDQESVQKAVASLKAKLKYNRADKINSMNLAYSHFQNLWPKTEKAKKFWEETLLVPLSVEWFQSSSELSGFFDKAWMKSGYDIRLKGGQSGEGVSLDKANLGNPDDSYTQMKELFAKTYEFVSKLKESHPAKKTAEWAWLVKYNQKISTNKYQRLIFIHERTWVLMEKSPEYADYVMVNQGINFIPSFPFFSLLLHELNVNSGAFFLLPRDTHLPEFQTLDQLNQKKLPKGFKEISQILRIQPEMSLIHLYSFLKTFEKFEYIK